MGIPCSPLCDRQTTLVEKSQIGFIDFIVEPSFNILGDMMETITEVLQKNKKGNDTIEEDEELKTTSVKPGMRGQLCDFPASLYQRFIQAQFDWL